ncbi:DUF2398 family protein [Streptomonospora litoralis]|uniref:TIGR02678 family protein n=1 Tax=Streptomonospora litoralis TaxID=2498135 RepID=A0A4P6Q778_9ACTN|nr:DUF2398 family protein [Streptomonospora litoralis]QBI56605.1 hypothetical protein EKD16_24305 [Streptomonospora litoralis]
MARRKAAHGVAPGDLADYQNAVRHVLTCDLITAQRPRRGVLEQVLRWADEISADLRELLDYSLIATTHQVRLVRRLDHLDGTQRSVFSYRRRRFDRRRLAYLCLVLGSFQRSRVEISLGDLIRSFAPAANAIAGLGFDPTVNTHKAAVVDVLNWLVDRGALRLSDGSLESWLRDSDRGDALFDIEHDTCALLFKPARQPQHLTSAAGLLHEPPGPESPSGRGDAARRARRLLVERPAAYYAAAEPDVAEALRAPELAEDMARLTGLVVERRAEGVMLADPAGACTDRPFPGRDVVSRAAGLLLAKIADLLEEHGQTTPGMPLPTLAEDHTGLLDRADAGLPHEGVVTELAWTAAEQDRDPGEPRERERADAPFVAESRLRVLIDELYEEFGAASFTTAWRNDPHGLLAEALAFLADLMLLRHVPGGVLVLPAALRYRNITAALHAQSSRAQLSLDITDPATDAEENDGAAS